MRLALGLALVLLAPLASAEDPEHCHDTPDVLFACVGGGVQGDCATWGYRYDQVLVMTPAGYVWVIGDSYCWTNEEGPYRDNNVIVGAGTPVASASVWWYESGGACRVMPRVYDAFGPLVIENLECPAGLTPPDAAWGELLA